MRRMYDLQGLQRCCRFTDIDDDDFRIRIHQLPGGPVCRRGAEISDFRRYGSHSGLKDLIPKLVGALPYYCNRRNRDFLQRTTPTTLRLADQPQWKPVYTRTGRLRRPRIHIPQC